MYSAFVFPLADCVILRHCIKWRSHSSLRRQKRASCSVPLCCHCVCEEAHKEMHMTIPVLKKGCYLSGFRTLRLTLLGWGPHSFTEPRFTETVNGDDSYVHGSGILWCDVISLDECLSTFRTVVIPSSSGPTIHVTHEDVDITTLRKWREIHGVTFQKTRILSNNAVRTCLHIFVGCLAGVCTLCVGIMTPGSIFVCLDFRFLPVWPSVPQ